MVIEKSVSKNPSDQLDQWKISILKSNQENLDSLIKECKFLEDLIQMMYGLYFWNLSILKDEIYQRTDLSEAEVAMIVGLKQRESFVYNLRSENTKSNLQDSKSCFDYLSYKCPEPRESSAVGEKEKGGDGNTKSTVNTKEDERRSKNIVKLNTKLAELQRDVDSLTFLNSCSTGPSTACSDRQKSRDTKMLNSEKESTRSQTSDKVAIILYLGDFA